MLCVFVITISKKLAKPQPSTARWNNWTSLEGKKKPVNLVYILFAWQNFVIYDAWLLNWEERYLVENYHAVCGLLPLQVCLQHVSHSQFLTYTAIVYFFGIMERENCWTQYRKAWFAPMWWSGFFAWVLLLLKPNVVHVLAAIMHITKHGHGENRASWGRGNPIWQTQHFYPGCNCTQASQVVLEPGESTSCVLLKRASICFGKILHFC